MAKKLVRKIGEEILEGLREIKRGEVGRVVTYPPVAETRARIGLSQSEFAGRARDLEDIAVLSEFGPPLDYNGCGER